jgi:hypothetical protein
MNRYEQTRISTRKTSLLSASIGAIYGLLIGTTFVLVAAYVDVWLHFELPIGVNGSQVLLRWLVIGLGITLIGALSSFFLETFQGLLVGTIAAGLLALVSALVLSAVSTGMKLIVLIFSLFPIAAMCLPLVVLLRYLPHQHVLALQNEQPWLRISVLIMAAVALGALGGYFMKMPTRALTSMQVIHKNIQAPLEQQDRQIRQVPGLKEHLGMRYVLFQNTSAVSTAGTDVRVLYEDGYTIQCAVVVFTEQSPYIRSCETIN